MTTKNQLFFLLDYHFFHWSHQRYHFLRVLVHESRDHCRQLCQQFETLNFSLKHQNLFGSITFHTVTKMISSTFTDWIETIDQESVIEHDNKLFSLYRSSRWQGTKMYRVNEKPRVVDERKRETAKQSLVARALRPKVHQLRRLPCHSCSGWDPVAESKGGDFSNMIGSPMLQVSLHHVDAQPQTRNGIWFGSLSRFTCNVCSSFFLLCLFYVKKWTNLKNLDIFKFFSSVMFFEKLLKSVDQL